MYGIADDACEDSDSTMEDIAEIVLNWISLINKCYSFCEGIFLFET